MTRPHFSRKERLAVQLGYRVSPDGIVTSPSGKVLKPFLGKHCEYPSISIGRGNGKVRCHRLQAFQLFGDGIYQVGIEVRHKDSNPENFRSDNLLLGTKVDNAFDKPKEVRIRSATIASDATRKHDHAAIIASYAAVGFLKTMAAFGVAKGTLSFILRKSTAAKLQEAV